MNDQLKIAQMNTKAVTAKLVEYEQRHAAQEKRVSEMEAKIAQLQQQLLQLQAIAAQQNSFGTGPTAR